MTSRQTALRGKAAAARARSPEEDQAVAGLPPDDWADQPEDRPEPDPAPAPAPEPDRASASDIAEALRQGRDVEVDDSQVIAWKIAQRILGSATADAVWEPIEPIDAFQVAERSIRIMEFEVLKSSFEGGLGVYLIIDAVDLSNGEMLLIKCGATNVVAQLLRAQELGALPENVKFQRRQSNLNQDRSLIWLRKVPAEQLP